VKPIIGVFLEFPDEWILFRDDHFFTVNDGFLVSGGLYLIISNDVKESYFDLSEVERIDLHRMLDKAKDIIEETRRPDG
jgi:diadenosine tetraphosphate (Ap4A) HIT family hydrolase